MLLSCPAILYSQVPTHVDPGHGDDAKRLSDNPEYIVLLVILIAVLVLFLLWIRRKK